MNLKKAPILTLAAFATIAIMITVATAAVLTTKTVTSQGSITASANIAVYSDLNLTTPCTSINWGPLSPGNSTTQIIYIKNTGNVPQTLSMNTTNWSSSQASSVLTVTWNKAGSTIAAGQIVPATLNLTAAPNTGTLLNFSFDIKIYGTGQ